MLGPNVPLEEGWLKNEVNEASHLIYIGWVGLKPTDAALVDPDRWTMHHPTVRMDETVGRLLSSSRLWTVDWQIAVV